MNEDLKKGDIVLAPLSYSDLVNNKLRPSLVLYHDTDVMQLSVAYISSKVPGKQEARRSGRRSQGEGKPVFAPGPCHLIFISGSVGRWMKSGIMDLMKAFDE